MSGWGVFALVLVIFFLIGQIRVGVDARYGEDGLLVKARLGLIRIKVFPFPAKDKGTAKKKQKTTTSKPEVVVNPSDTVKSASKPVVQTNAPEQTEKKKSSKADKKVDEDSDKKAGKKMSLDQILGLAQEFVPLALEAVGSLWSKLVMDELELSIIVGSSDPADTAMLYGQINAAMGAVWQPLSQAFHVKNGRAHVGVNFEAQNITLYVHAALSIKIGQILQLASHFGVKALRKFMKFQNEQKAKQQERKAV